MTGTLSRWPWLVVLLLALGGCAAAGAGAAAERDVILAAEIQQRPAANAYELVQALRPQWLRTRGTQNLPGKLDPEGSGQGVGEALGQDVVVYLDHARMGGRSALRGIPLSSVQYIRYFNAAAANYRWGAGHTQGAILVSTQPLAER